MKKYLLIFSFFLTILLLSGCVQESGETLITKSNEEIQLTNADVEETILQIIKNPLYTIVSSDEVLKDTTADDCLSYQFSIENRINFDFDNILSTTCRFDSIEDAKYFFNGSKEEMSESEEGELYEVISISPIGTEYFAITKRLQGKNFPIGEILFRIANIVVIVGAAYDPQTLSTDAVVKLAKKMEAKIKGTSKPISQKTYNELEQRKYETKTYLKLFDETTDSFDKFASFIDLIIDDENYTEANHYLVCNDPKFVSALSESNADYDKYENFYENAKYIPIDLNKLYDFNTAPLLNMCDAISEVFDENYSIYSNDTIGFQMIYPKGWRVDSSLITQIVFFSPLENAGDTFAENVQVRVGDLSQTPMTMDELEESKPTAIQKQYTNAEIFKNERDTLNGHPILNVHYYYSLNQYDVIEYSTSFIVDNYLYTFFYQGLEADYEKYLPQVNDMRNSLRIIE